MRKTVAPDRKAVTRSLSIYPEQHKFIAERCTKLRMSESRFYQMLVDHEMRTNKVTQHFLDSMNQAVAPA